MFSHIMVGSNDLERSKQFYDAVLGALGFTDEALANTAKSGHGRLFYFHNGAALGITQPIDDEAARPGNGSTIGFACTSPEQVKAFHDAGVAHGGTSIEDPPGLRQAGLGPMHLSYLRDPDGNKLCAIYRAS